MADDRGARRTVLTPDVIRQALDRVATVLDTDGVAAQIVVDGGAALALAYFATDRPATADVDAVYQPAHAVEIAARGRDSTSRLSTSRAGLRPSHRGERRPPVRARCDSA